VKFTYSGVLGSDPIAVAAFEFFDCNRRIRVVDWSIQLVAQGGQQQAWHRVRLVISKEYAYRAVGKEVQFLAARHHSRHMALL
jgi:hypothetical protein